MKETIPKPGVRFSPTAVALVLLATLGWRAECSADESGSGFVRQVAPAGTVTRSVTLLPAVNTYVDPANLNTSFAGQPLIVSAVGNATQKVAYVRFDLDLVPSSATIKAAQFYFTVKDTVAKQEVKLLLVDDDNWGKDITFDTAPKPTAKGIGTWLAENKDRVITPAVNPMLVGTLQQKLGAGGSRKLSFQISSTFGQEGGPTSNTYFSFETASEAKEFASGPRLIVQYELAAEPLERNWEQLQADARHSGRSPWAFANSPTKTYPADEVLSGIQLSSSAIIRDNLLYLFTPTTLEVLDPAEKTPKTLISGLATFGTTALGPNGLLYAAAKTELAAFDLTAGGKKTISVELSNFSAMTAGPDGSVYLTQDTTIFSFTPRLGSLAPSWSKDLKTTKVSQATLSADGSQVYVASEDKLYALNNADGSERWVYNLPSKANWLTIPVAGSANGLSYFGADNTLYVFGDISTPRQTFSGSEQLSQPVIDATDTLYVLQGETLYTVVSTDTTIKKGPELMLPGIKVPPPIAPVMDGAGNVYILNNTNKNESELIVVTLKDQKLEVATQYPLDFPVPNPTSMQIAPNGSLFVDSASALLRVKPGVADAVTVLSFADSTSYRAASTLTLSGGAVPANGSVVFQSGGTITIQPGFSVPVGARAVFNTGY